MATVSEALTTVLIVSLLPPFAFILFVVLFTASLGKSLGLREKYVEILIKVFEFGKTRLASSRRHDISPNESETDSSEEEILSCGEEEETGSSGNEVIAREVVLRPHAPKKLGLDGTEDFKLWDPLYYVRTGVEAIVDDEVTKRFTAEELTSWNLLTRTNYRHQFVSVRLTIFWVVGFLARYLVLLPIRGAILLVGTLYVLVGTLGIGQLPEGPIKQWLANCVFLSMFRIMGRVFSNVVYYHNIQNRPKSDGICVANHTSPIDCIVLAQDGCFSFVGQRHGGFLGLLQRALSRASSHIWFERSEAKDRYAVASRLRDHVEDPDKLPILIFPEGTCINNTSVMQFKKGTFEVGGTIYPVAIKYDPRFGDAFWNSSEYGMMSYILMMMTSWAIVCDVWYLAPVTRQDGETSIDFANRVKAEIARQGGLVDLIWDGGLKRTAPKKEWREQHQQEFSQRLRLHSVSTLRTSARRRHMRLQEHEESRQEHKIEHGETNERAYVNVNRSICETSEKTYVNIKKTSTDETSERAYVNVNTSIGETSEKAYGNVKKTSTNETSKKACVNVNSSPTGENSETATVNDSKISTGENSEKVSINISKISTGENIEITSLNVSETSTGENSEATTVNISEISTGENSKTQSVIIDETTSVENSEMMPIDIINTASIGVNDAAPVDSSKMVYIEPIIIVPIDSVATKFVDECIKVPDVLTNGLLEEE